MPRQSRDTQGPNISERDFVITNVFERYFANKFSGALSRTRYAKRYKGLGCMSRKQWDNFLEHTYEQRRTLWNEWINRGRLRRYAPSIDRIDPSKGYFPINCQWLPLHLNSGRHRVVVKTIAVCGHPYDAKNNRNWRYCSKCKKQKARDYYVNVTKPKLEK